MSRIDETLDGCVQPLRRDPEIALDVRRELAGHLEEHLDAGMSEEEALRRFGDPGEIGAGLFQANFKRLNLRAKMRLAVKILAVPAVIGAVFFLLVLFAALTSSISLMETAVSILRDKFGWERKKATLLVTLYVLILGAVKGGIG